MVIETTPTPELVALLELSERATPGIWEMYGGTNHGRVQTADVIVCDGSPPHFMGKEDAKFIAALVNWFRSTRAATVPQGVVGFTLAELDAAFDDQIVRVSTLEYNSNEICRHFYGELRKKLTPPPAELGRGEES